MHYASHHHIFRQYILTTKTVEQFLASEIIVVKYKIYSLQKQTNMFKAKWRISLHISLELIQAREQCRPWSRSQRLVSGQQQLYSQSPLWVLQLLISVSASFFFPKKISSLPSSTRLPPTGDDGHCCLCKAGTLTGQKGNRLRMTYMWI